MKTELTQQLKERFFALYHGQTVVQHKEPDDFWKDRLDVVDWYLAETIDHVHLALRPISSITDEEAIEVAKMYRPESHWLHDAKYAKSFMVDFGASKNYFDAAIRAADYLRSIGVALPFAGHSVQELCDAGWVKLIDKP